MVESRGKRPTKKKVKPTKSEKTRPPRTVVDPEATLKERDRQLRELTDQSLHFLDLLQAAQEKGRGLEELEQKVGKLEEVLADARRRVRASRSVLIPGGGGDPATRLEIVIWPHLPGALAGANVRELASRYPTVSVNCICAAQDAPIDRENNKPANLQILAAECHTGPQFWNTAMAATEAPLVLFLAAGVQPGEGLDPLKAVHDDVLALGQPAFVHHDGQTTLGLRETKGFDFQRNPAPHGSSGLVELEYIAAEAFVIRRDAFHLLGPFDEDMGGYLALVDYSLRARNYSLRTLGLPDLWVTVPEGVDLLTTDQQAQRDRLILLALHRPGQVSKVLGGMDLPWDLPAEQLQQYLRALFLRLPGTKQCPEALDVLVQEAVTLGRQAIPGPVIEQPLQAIQELVESALDQKPADLPQPSLEDHEPIDAVRIRLDTLRATFDKLRVQIEDERSTNRGLLDRLTAQVEGERLAKGELMDRHQSYQSALDSLKAELDNSRTTGEQLRVNLEKERAVNEDVTSELEARQALVARLTGEVEAERDRRERDKNKLNKELDRAKESQHLLDEGMVMIGRALNLEGLEKEPAVNDDVTSELEARQALVARLTGEVEAQRDRTERDRKRLNEELDRAKESQHLLDEGMVMIGRALNLEGQLDPVILADSAHAMRSALEDRNRWVALLLGEIQRRRLKPFPRPLTVGEKAFLGKQGQVGKK